MSEIRSLPERDAVRRWIKEGSCVFFNFAWSGGDGVAAGDHEDQLKNVSFSTDAVKVAKQLGCSKYVDSGSMEETFVERFLNNHWPQHDYNSSQRVYGLSKLTARDMCHIVAYIEKIDYIHTRLSGPVDLGPQCKGFISVSLRKILNGESMRAGAMARRITQSSAEEAKLAAFRYPGRRRSRRCGAGPPPSRPAHPPRARRGWPEECNQCRYAARLRDRPGAACDACPAPSARPWASHGTTAHAPSPGWQRLPAAAQGSGGRTSRPA